MNNLLGLSLVQTPAVTSTGEPVMYQYMPPGPSEPVNPVRDTGFQLDATLGSGKPSPFMVLLSVCVFATMNVSVLLPDLNGSALGM